jgi:iron complex outermembrane receptor protein
MRWTWMTSTLAVATMTAVGPAWADHACTLTLDVHAVDADAHEAVADAEVTIDGIAVGATDATGHLAVGGQCPGPRAVALTALGFEPAAATVNLTRTTTTEVELAFAIGESIAVVGKRPPLLSTTADITLDANALATRRGRGFADVLDGIPGVAMLRSASGMAKPVVRGQYGRRLVTLVDGVRHRAQEWGVDHAPEIDPFIASAITVVRGAAGVRFGPDAIGGAVLVAPPALPLEPGLDAELHLSGGTGPRGGSLAARVLGTPQRWPALHGLIEASARRASAQSAPTYPLDNTAATEGSFGAAVRYGRTDDAGVQLTWRRYMARLGVCTCLRIDSRDDFLAQLERDEPLGVENYRPDFDIERPYQTVTHDLLLGRGKRPLTDAVDLTATYAFQADVRHEFDHARDLSSDAQFRFQLYTHDLDVAVAHEPLHLSDRAHLEGRAGVVGTAQVHEYGGLPLIPDHVGGGGGVYAIERLYGHPGQLELGLRYDVLHRGATFDRIDYLRLVRGGQLEQDACGTVTDATERVTCTSTFHTLSASLGGIRQLTARATLKLDLSTASRPPNTDEQYLSGTAPTLPVLALGKPTLGAETTYSAAATLSYQGPRLAAEVSAYGSWIDDYIDLMPALGPDGAQIYDVLIRGTFPRFVTRAVDATFVGIDGGVTALPWPWLELTASGSMVRARDRDADRFLPLVPPDRATLGATLKRSALWGLGPSQLGLTATLVRRQDRTDASTDLAPAPPGYALVGLQAGSEVTSAGRPVRFSLEVQNLTNARYRDYTSLLRYFADQPGRQVLLRLSIPLAAGDGD